MPRENRIWERGWNGHEQEQLIRLARLPLPQYLLWLEDAHRLIRQLASGPPDSDLAGTDVKS